MIGGSCLHSGHLGGEAGASYFTFLCFSLVCGMCSIYHVFFFFALPVGIIDRLCSVIVHYENMPIQIY